MLIGIFITQSKYRKRSISMSVSIVIGPKKKVKQSNVCWVIGSANGERFVCGGRQIVKAPFCLRW